MRDEVKTKGQLIAELRDLRRRLQDCEQAKAESQRLASFPQLNPNPVLEIDATGAVTFCNESALAVLKLLGESAGPEAFFPQDLEDILQAAREHGERRFYREVRLNEAVFAVDISHTAPVEGLRFYARDITRHERAEAALRESQNDLNRAQAVAHTGSWRLNMQRNELLWSDETYRIFGFPPGRPLTYESFLAAVHPEDREYVDRQWQAALRGEPYDLEHRIVVGDTVKWVRERAELEFDPQGGLIGGFGTAQDITERKQAEAALVRSNQRLDLLAETAGQLLVSDSPQRIVDSLCLKVMEFLNCDAFFNFLVDEKEGRLRLNAFAGIPEKEARRIEWLEYGVAVCGCAARDGRRIVAEDILTTDDPRTDLVKSYGIQAYACHPLITQGRVLGTLSFGTRKRSQFTIEELSLMKAVADQVAIAIDRQQSDEALRMARDELELRVEERTVELEETVAQLEEEIADRLRAEESLRRQAELLNLAHDAIIVRDLNSQVVFWSRGAEETYGWEQDEAQGRTCHILLQTQFPIPLRAIEQRVLQQGRWEGELTQAKADGTSIIVASRWALQLDEVGNPVAMLEINRDITQRKQAEQALEAERRRLFAVLERIPAYVALISPDCKIPFANREFIRRFGNPGDRLCYEFLFGLEAPCEGCKSLKVFETGTPEAWEWTGPDGNTYQIYDHPFTDADGSPLVLELGVDISHLKSIEGGIRRQSAILDGINRIFREALTCETEAELGRTCLTVAEELTGAEFGLIYEVNPNGRLDALTISDPGWAACRMGTPGEHVLPKNLQVRGLYRRVIQDGASMIANDPEAHPDRMGTPAGHPPLTSFLGVPLRQGDRVMGLIGLGNKAGGFHPADQEAAETLAAATVEALRRFRAEKQAANLGRLYRLLSKVNEVIVRAPDQASLFRETCRIAVQEGKFIMAWIGLNDPASRTVKPVAQYGFEEGYLEGLLISLDNVPECRGPTGMAVREGRINFCNDFASDSRMSVWREKALARGYRSSAAFPLKVGSQVMGALTLYAGRPDFFTKDELDLLESLAGDLSFAMESMDREVRRRQAEEEIRRLNEELEDRVRERTAELEFANQEMESFSYSVSHDLKAPLRAIQGFSRMLLGEQADRLDQEGLRLLHVIINNTQVMAKLIDDLLALSRLGRHQIRRSKIDLAAMAGKIFEQLRAAEPGRDLRLTMPDLPPAWGDYSLLNQVMTNLLDNAVKYTRHRRTAVIELGGYTQGGEEIYFVKDNGVGFDGRYVHKLFGVFQRLHGGSDYEGTGVGLAIVQRIIQRHGGRVWAEGHIDQGATFFFSLPKAGIESENPEETP